MRGWAGAVLAISRSGARRAFPRRAPKNRSSMTRDPLAAGDLIAERRFVYAKPSGNGRRNRSQNYRFPTRLSTLSLPPTPSAASRLTFRRWAEPRSSSYRSAWALPISRPRAPAPENTPISRSQAPERRRRPSRDSAASDRSSNEAGQPSPGQAQVWGGTIRASTGCGVNGEVDRSAAADAWRGRGSASRDGGRRGVAARAGGGTASPPADGTFFA